METICNGWGTLGLSTERPAFFTPGDGLRPGHLWIETDTLATWRVRADGAGVRSWEDASGNAGKMLVTQRLYGGLGSFLITYQFETMTAGSAPLPNGYLSAVFQPPAGQTVAVTLNPASPIGSNVLWTIPPAFPVQEAVALLQTDPATGIVIVDVLASGGGIALGPTSVSLDSIVQYQAIPTYP